MGQKSLYLFPSSHFPPPLHPTPIHQSMLAMEKAGDRSDSQCCSGSQSGWTLYLEQSQSQSQSVDHRRTNSSVLQEEEEEEEDVDDETEEDLSMLSDASSGPPHAHDDEENYSSGCSDEGEGFRPLTRVGPEFENCKRRRVEEGHGEEENSGDSTLSFISKATSGSNKCLLMEDENSSFSATHF